MRTLQNTVMVLAATALMAAAVYTGVSALGTSGATVALGSTQTCPATGCTAASCHATSTARGSGNGRHGQHPRASSTTSDESAYSL